MILRDLVLNGATIADGGSVKDEAWRLLRETLRHSIADSDVDVSPARPAPWALDATLEHAEGGKPRFTDWPGVSFSISHCTSREQAAVMCAIELSDSISSLPAPPVGCDVELVSRFERLPEPFAKRFPTGPAAKIVRSLDPNLRPEALCALWTAEEAFGKMTGSGIGREVISMDFSPVLEAYLENPEGLVEVCALGCRFTCYASGSFRLSAAVGTKHTS